LAWAGAGGVAGLVGEGVGLGGIGLAGRAVDGGGGAVRQEKKVAIIILPFLNIAAMKKLLATASTLSAMSAAAIAGSTAAPMIAPAAPTLGGWFVGATYGQLETGADIGTFQDYNQAPASGSYSVDDIDFDLYTLQIGRDLDMPVLGFDMAAYLEIGMATGDGTVRYDGSGSYSDLELQLIPITINVKLERAVFGAVSAYLTSGVGYVFSEAEYSDGDNSTTDGGFYAQASAGLTYHVNEKFEVFGGARWMYLDDVEFGGDEDFSVNLDDNFAWEVGARYNF